MPIIITAAGVVIVLIALALIVPHPNRQLLRDTLSIWTEKFLELFTSATERANRKIEKMREKLDGEKTRASDLRGSLNHQVKNVLAKRQGELDQAEADYALAQSSGKFSQEELNSFLDKIGAAEVAVAQQNKVIEDYRYALDASRLAIAQSAAAIQRFASEVKSAEAHEVATRALSTAAEILRATSDGSELSSEINGELNKVSEKYEQAKARYEDAMADNKKNGSDADRKLAVLKEQNSRDEIVKRIEARRAARTAN